VLGALSLAPPLARADAVDLPRLRPKELPAPRLPAPFVLPELSHPRPDARIDWFVGRMSPEDASRPASTLALARVGGEMSVLVPRKLYVGFVLPYAAALPPDGAVPAGYENEVRASGARAALGNLEAHVRAVFAMPSFLEYGFGLGVVAPTARFDRNFPPNRSATEAAASVEPTDYVHFLPGRVALRPAADLRILRGQFVLQTRQGIDILIDDKGIERARTAGRLLLHLGWLARNDLEFSLEATQVYFFFSDEKVTNDGARLTAAQAIEEKYRISDDRRTAVTIGPGIRFSLRDIDVGGALVTNLVGPLSSAGDGFIALRLSVIAHVP
jgi:hypothetical protein